MPGGEPDAPEPGGVNTPEPEPTPASAPQFDSDDDFAKLFDQLANQGPQAPEAPQRDPNAGIAPGTPDAVRARFPIGLPVTASEAITSSSDRAPRAGKVERIERDVDRRTQRPRTVVHVRMDESGRVERFIVKDNGFIRPEQLRPVRAADVPDEFTDGQGGRYVDPMARERGRRGGNRTAMIGRVERGEQRSAAEGDEYEEYMAAAGQARRDARDAAAERGWVSDAGYRALREAAADDGRVVPGRRTRTTLDQLVESGHMEPTGDGAYRLTATGRAKVGAPDPDPVPVLEPTPEPEAPADPLDAVRAASGRERGELIRGLDDGQLGDLMTRVAMDRDAPDRKLMIGAINRENNRRLDERAAAADAERARVAEATAVEKRAADRALAQRIAELEDITPGSNNPAAFMASGVQRAARSGESIFMINDKRSGRKLRLFDTPPAPKRAEGPMMEFRPDGSMIAHYPRLSIMGGADGWDDDKQTMTPPGRLHAQIGAYVDRHASRAERDAVEPEPYRPYTTDGGPTPVDHVDTSGLSGGAREAAHRALQAIARVHRVDGMAHIRTEMEEPGADRGGAYRSGTAGDRITINDDTPTPAIDFAHEYGHAVDRHGLVMPSLPMFGSEVLAAATEDAPIRQSAEGRAMKAAFASIRASESYKRGRRDGKSMPKYVDYWSSEVELWARAYSQFIAVRSGDERLMADLRRMQIDDMSRPVPMQWGDADFEPIADAVEAVLRARGWMD